MSAKPKVTFTLDGKPIEAFDGQLVLDAAKGSGVEIPHYCYHPALGNPGVCRLCMVEVEGMPKLQVSCRLPVKQGMVVKSASPAARRAQASSLELHLANHPLDCPVCDQAGECYLQDYYQRFGGYKSTVKENKVHKKKRQPIGKHIMLDSERCILCTRCTRFVDNVTKTHELGIFNRGGKSEIMLTPGATLDNAYSGNVADICPVGALTDRDFRFKVRVWYLEKAPSICTGCARGCSIEVHSNLKRPWHTDGKRVARLAPRPNPEVNGWWICDDGRYGYGFVDAPTRLRRVSLMDAGNLQAVAWDKAVATISTELKEQIDKRGAEGLAVVLSGTLSNEDLFAAKKLFTSTLKAGHILVRPGPDQLGVEDELLRRKEKVPNHRGAELLGFGSMIEETTWDEIRKGVTTGNLWGLFVVDRDPVQVWGTDPGIAKLPFSAYLGVNSNRFAQVARWVLPSAAWTEEEASYTNFEGKVQRVARCFPPLGEARSDWRIFGGLIKALGGDFAPDSPKTAFEELCRTEAEFKRFTWNSTAPAPYKAVEA